MDGINYGKIFESTIKGFRIFRISPILNIFSGDNKRFIIAIFALFILIFYGVFQLYGAKFQAKEGEEATSQDNTVAIPAQDSPQPSAIEFAQLPERAAPNEKFIVEWLINSDEPKTTSHAAVHYGYESRPGTFSADTTPQMAGYELFTPEFASGEYPIPNMFVTAAELPKKGIVYMRAHAIIDGKNYWAEERTVVVE